MHEERGSRGASGGCAGWQEYAERCELAVGERRALLPAARVSSEHITLLLADISACESEMLPACMGELSRTPPHRHATGPNWVSCSVAGASRGRRIALTLVYLHNIPVHVVQ